MDGGGNLAGVTAHINRTFSSSRVKRHGARLKCPGQHSSTWPAMQKRVIYIAAGLLVAIAVAVVLALALGKSKSTSSSSANDAPTTTVAPSSNVTSADLLGTPTTAPPPGVTVTTTPVPSPASDPEKGTPVLTMLAIGDWGSTTGKISGTSLDTAGDPGSCCKTYGGSGANANKVDPTKARISVDYWAQNYVSTILSQSAATLKPKPARVIGHGDNIYWDGAGPGDIAYRMEETFEKKYAQDSLAGIKWVNVAGNHDIGGSAYICGEKDNNFRECTSTDELLKYLDAKFNLQATYKSPNQDRWLMKDHYYVESVKSVDGSVTVDIFNVDTNYADSHGLQQVCCQCYGYTQKTGVKCTGNEMPGDANCAGGDKAMYNACADKINGWAKASLEGAARDLAKSNATYKLINTHYSPHFHMAEDKMLAWYNLTKTYGVHAWFNGHTHGFNHDMSKWFTHFFENGGGGGIFTDTSTAGTNAYVDNLWVAGGNPYGFMELSFTKDWMKVNFATFDTAWSFGGFNYEATKTGGIARGHCWYIPSVIGTKGQECKASVDTPLGAPIMPDNS
ncbi:hypothetical protein Ae201684P_016090 [Aphanomyces euteiches]|uniref:Calcineurin-like phosphoesterase domain-containing protein n=1 Tax=Aphanomyces euteiches TaxID=100861 RepID=A0A6G0XHQ8_9STRA|nr:hypothetical protein Ae201684_004570 [Aphanomyces euteiches]KAH9093462.1 hypothetical protein Ae201684P_016090 [Aphanomyces euteiches]